MNELNKIILILFVLGIFTSCNKTVEVKTVSSPAPTYFYQLYKKGGTKLTSSEIKFGDLEVLEDRFITNDSSAFIWVFKIAEGLRGEDQSHPFYEINEFKLYNSRMVEITNTVEFEGIENYPNPRFE